MSDLRDFLNSISSITSDTINLPEFINIKQIGGSQCGDADNTSTDNTELRNVQASTTSESATSSANKTAVLGASVGPTSNISNINQPVQTQSGGNISKLLELLSSESDTELNLSTATDQLEDQLKALLQAGGAMKKKASKKSKKKPSKKSKKKTSKKSKKKPSKKYWRDKIENNMRRDKRYSRRLRRDGWSVLRLWEHDIEKNPEKCRRKILAKFRSR